MKNKILIFFMTVVIAISLCGCGGSNSEEIFTPASSTKPSDVVPQESDLVSDLFTPKEAKPGMYQTISSDGLSFFVIKNDNTLWGWGGNGCGQLGIGTYGKEDCYEPVLVMEDVIAVDTWCDGSGACTLILKKDNTLWACGHSRYGQLGVGTAEDGVYSIPVYVMDDVISIHTRSGDSFAIKSDHSLWAWGQNLFGELGTGSVEPQFSPMKVLDDVESVSSSGSCTFAVKTDGTLWAWGSSRLGAIAQDSIVPVQIMSDVFSVCDGSGWTGVIKTDGTLWVYGVFANADLSSPVYVMDSVVALKPNGSSGLYILKNDGTLWKKSTDPWLFYLSDDRTFKFWIDTELPEDQEKNLVAIDGGLYDIPMVVKSDGTLLNIGECYQPIDDIKLS